MTLDDFSVWACEQCKQRGLTLKGAADLIEVNRETIMAVENGHRPYMDTIERIAKGFGYRVNLTLVPEGESE